MKTAEFFSLPYFSIIKFNLFGITKVFRVPIVFRSRIIAEEHKNNVFEYEKKILKRRCNYIWTEEFLTPYIPCQRILRNFQNFRLIFAHFSTVSEKLRRFFFYQKQRDDTELYISNATIFKNKGPLMDILSLTGGAHLGHSRLICFAISISHFFSDQHWMTPEILISLHKTVFFLTRKWMKTEWFFTELFPFTQLF